MEERHSMVAQDRRTVGLITIGQSLRVDMVPEMSRWLGPARVLERGALDGMGRPEISALRPGPDDYPLVTRLNDGSSVTIAKRMLLPRIQSAITELEDRGADVVVLVCTGELSGVPASGFAAHGRAAVRGRDEGDLARSQGRRPVPSAEPGGAHA